MKKETTYEWCVEVRDNDDCYDCDFADKYKDLPHYDGDVALTRRIDVYLDGEWDGLVSRWYAYVEGGKLRENFEDNFEGTPKVPARFHKELAKEMRT